jgi:hypothetical protein
LRDDDKVYVCDECGVEFNNIFDYLKEHEEDFKVLLPLGNIGIDLMDALKDLYSLVEEGDYETTKMLLSGIGAALYAYANGDLEEIVDEIIIEETVEKETKNLDIEIIKLLGKGNTDEQV